MFAKTQILFFIFVISIVDGFVINEDHDSVSGQVPSSRAAADCTNWHKSQIDPEVHLKKTSKPPCRIPLPFPPKKLDNGWLTDPGCDAAKQPNGKTCGYHVGAHGCYRHSFKPTGPGAQACYNKTGHWISDTWQGAGTLDVETPLGSLVQQYRHYLVDVKSYDDCCTSKPVNRDLCNLYYEKRPPGECEDK